MVVNHTSGTRTPADVTVMPKVHQRVTLNMTQAVYCTCWDGDIAIHYDRAAHHPTVRTTQFQLPAPAETEDHH
jgi:hypothetical protein